MMLLGALFILMNNIPAFIAAAVGALKGMSPVPQGADTEHDTTGTRLRHTGRTAGAWTYPQQRAKPPTVDKCGNLPEAYETRDHVEKVENKPRSETSRRRTEWTWTRPSCKRSSAKLTARSTPWSHYGKRRWDDATNIPQDATERISAGPTDPAREKRTPM